MAAKEIRKFLSAILKQAFRPAQGIDLYIPV